MKTSKKIICVALISIAIILSCKKSKTTDSSASQTASENYSSVYDFYSKNVLPLQTYTFNASTGGSVVTPQGTKITIPANAFVSALGSTISGIVTIQFKDIYKKVICFWRI